MSRSVFRWLAVGLGLLLTATPLRAHHNITGKFDPHATKPHNDLPDPMLYNGSAPLKTFRTISENRKAR